MPLQGVFCSLFLRIIDGSCQDLFKESATDIKKKHAKKDTLQQTDVLHAFIPLTSQLLQQHSRQNFGELIYLISFTAPGGFITHLSNGPGLT